MNPLSTPAGGSAFLHELEVDVCTELTLAETGPPEEEALGLPIEEWLSDPADDAALRSRPPRPSRRSRGHAAQRDGRVAERCRSHESTWSTCCG